MTKVSVIIYPIASCINRAECNRPHVQRFRTFFPAGRGPSVAKNQKRARPRKRVDGLDEPTPTGPDRVGNRNRASGRTQIDTLYLCPRDGP